jgi:hypothetical protein
MGRSAISTVHHDSRTPTHSTHFLPCRFVLGATFGAGPGPDSQKKKFPSPNILQNNNGDHPRQQTNTAINMW